MPDVGARQRDSQKFITFAQFEKMNTRLARTALPDTQAAWLENLQPIGPNNLVPVPDANRPLTILFGGQTVNVSFFANIGDVDYLIVFTNAGAGVAVNLIDGTQTTFASNGTFSLQPDMTVYNSARILIADSLAGYCTWDGKVFVTAGGISPNIKVTNGGSGYTSAPAVAFSGGSGSGATAHAVLAGTAVVSVVLDTAGTGYKAGDTITVGFSGGGGTGAAATAVIWPTLAGTTIAIFSGRVWIANGHVLNYTGTGGFDDTNPANAAGATTTTDADLSHSIQAVRTLNNYLYIFGDQSVRQIGSITVSSSLTLFTPLVLASDIGTSFKYTILSYNRLVLFANKNGVYAIFGASVEKISDDMDGIFGGSGVNHSNIDFSVTPTASLQDLRNIHCYILLVRYLDPRQGPRPLMLCFQEKTWFVASQGSLVTITSSFLQASQQWETFASTGSDITQLFQDATSPVPVKMQTALSFHGNIMQAKRAIRAGIGAVMSGGQFLSMAVESERTSQSYTLTGGQIVTWMNSADQIVVWFSSITPNVMWIGTNFSMLYSGVEGYGKCLGLTITGTVVGAVISMAAIEYQDAALWG